VSGVAGGRHRIGSARSGGGDILVVEDLTG